jgi:hypothetical protein
LPGTNALAYWAQKKVSKKMKYCEYGHIIQVQSLEKMTCFILPIFFSAILSNELSYISCIYSHPDGDEMTDEENWKFQRLSNHWQKLCLNSRSGVQCYKNFYSRKLQYFVIS